MPWFKSLCSGKRPHGMRYLTSLSSNRRVLKGPTISNDPCARFSSLVENNIKWLVCPSPKIVTYPLSSSVLTGIRETKPHINSIFEVLSYWPQLGLYRRIGSKAASVKEQIFWEYGDSTKLSHYSMLMSSKRQAWRLRTAPESQNSSQTSKDIYLSSYANGQWPFLIATERYIDGSFGIAMFTNKEIWKDCLLIELSSLGAMAVYVSTHTSPKTHLRHILTR